MTVIIFLHTLADLVCIACPLGVGFILASAFGCTFVVVDCPGGDLAYLFLLWFGIGLGIFDTGMILLFGDG